jgi:hypothetical protein
MLENARGGNAYPRAYLDRPASEAKFDRSKYFASLGLLILSIGEAAA